VGGIGMSGLAEVLLNLGYEVSGSDLHSSPIVERLEGLGLRFHAGHAPEHIGDAGILVVSAAVPDDNPELLEAAQRGLPVIHRSQLLADLMRLKPQAVAVGGTHGKTSTTSMISAILDVADIGATTIVGGILHRSGTNAHWGTGECLVAEVDEHDGSFLNLHPTVAVVTNIDAEHLEYYGTLDQIKRAFTDFCNKVPFYGCCILCHDDPAVKSIIPDLEAVHFTYGLSPEASLEGKNIKIDGGHDGDALHRLANLHTKFEVRSHEHRLADEGVLGTLEVAALGTHNVRNALAACAVGLHLGLEFDQVAEGLRHFDGVQRRLQVRGMVRDIVVVEDYAHHPTEIAATLEAVRWVSPGRTVVIFQPHLYSRTRYFADAFADVLAQADLVIVTDIYASREAPMPGVDAGMLVERARRSGHSHLELVRDMTAVPATLAPRLQPNDLVLVLGAGNINQIVPPLLGALEAV
jgi:UDP-N-acetylmuramate--alanine ligase